MKRMFLFLFVSFAIISCSDDEFTIDEQNNDQLLTNTELIEPSQNVSQTEATAEDGEIVVSNADYNSLCVDNCNLDAQACYNWATHLKNQHLLACDLMLIIGTETVDVFCTRNVIVGYNTIVTPEGEVIEIPIFEEETFVCGQETINIYTTDPVLIQEAEDCRVQALIEFVDAIDKCDINKSKCLKKCKKGPLDEL
ncbi:MAG: hypothetical protein AAGA77_12200 [Bacteroidota bacterium]